MWNNSQRRPLMTPNGPPTPEADEDGAPSFSDGNADFSAMIQNKWTSLPAVSLANSAKPNSTSQMASQL